jgi:cystathionine beta-synthase
MLSNSSRTTEVALVAGVAAVAGVVVGSFWASRRAEKKNWNTEPKICDTILDHIGNTPLVRLNRLGKDEGVEAEVLVKCEFFNAGGSVKDRIGKRMVQDAIKSGRIKPGDTIIEPTSGNTGIGLALSSAVLGYKAVIVLPKKMSQEKVDVLNALGAVIKRTPTDAPCPVASPGYPYSHIAKAIKVRDQLNAAAPGTAHILDQYKNPSNPLAHIEGTAQEILKQCDGKLDVLVATAGTGGTLAGIAFELKKHLPHLVVVGVDPHGSDLAVEKVGKIRNASKDFRTVGDTNASEPKLGAYHVEGIGYDFIPDVLAGLPGVNPNARTDLVDYWYKTSDRESFVMSRRAIREEGLLCGGSCGSALVGAFQVCKDLKLKKTDRVVVILADSTRNYMTKFLSDSWMEEKGFAEDSYKPVAAINQLKVNSAELENLSCADSWRLQSKQDPSALREMDRNAL